MGLDDVSLGHQRGAEHIEEALSTSKRCSAGAPTQITHVTIFVASIDNLSRRAPAEIDFLMRLAERVIPDQLAGPSGRWQIHLAGRLDLLPDSTARAPRQAPATGQGAGGRPGLRDRAGGSWSQSRPRLTRATSRAATPCRSKLSSSVPNLGSLAPRWHGNGDKRAGEGGLGHEAAIWHSLLAQEVRMNRIVGRVSVLAVTVVAAGTTGLVGLASAQPTSHAESAAAAVTPAPLRGSGGTPWGSGSLWGSGAPGSSGGTPWG